MSSSASLDPSLIIQLTTLAATVFGWFYTAIRQRAILQETREYQRKDRELTTSRARMDKATSLTKSIIEASDHWYKLAAFAQATVDEGAAKQFQSMAEPLLRNASFSKLNLAVIMYDPQFRSLRNQLDKSVSEKIGRALVASEEKIKEFFAQTYWMQATDSDVDEKVKFIAEAAGGIGHSLVEAANELSNAFASLDESLARNA